MKTDLDLIIKDLKKEKQRIEQDIKECIDMQDYIGAHYFMPAYDNIRQQLEKFLHLKNPNIPKIRDQVRAINWQRRYLKKRKNLEPNYYLEILKKELANAEKELDELRIQKQKPSLDNFLIHDLLEDLVSKRIKRFKFILRAQENLELGLRIIRNNLIIDLTNIQKPTRPDSFEQQRMIRLKKIGFDFYGTKVEKVIENFTLAQIPIIIEILARTIYDVFDISELEDQINLIIEY